MSLTERNRPAHEVAAEDLFALITARTITTEAEFVRRSHSRNAEEKHPTLNWRFRVLINGKPSGPWYDYSAGIAHLPGYNAAAARTRDGARCLDLISEHGKLPMGGMYSAILSTKPIPAPRTQDLVASLLLDSSGADMPFEDWAHELGYDSDSIKAKAAWEQCREIRFHMVRTFGSDFDRALELAQSL